MLLKCFSGWEDGLVGKDFIMQAWKPELGSPARLSKCCWLTNKAELGSSSSMRYPHWRTHKKDYSWARHSNACLKFHNSGGRGRWTSVKLRPAWSTEFVQEYPGLCTETLSPTIKPPKNIHHNEVDFIPEM